MKSTNGELTAQQPRLVPRSKGKQKAALKESNEDPFAEADGDFEEDEEETLSTKRMSGSSTSRTESGFSLLGLWNARHARHATPRAGYFLRATC